MSTVYDSLDQHLPHAPDMAHALVPMGMLLAWAVNQHLVSEHVLTDHEQLVLRVRFQEVGGSQLLAACGGDLRRDMFNRDGVWFLDRYYPDYLRHYEELFGSGYTLDDDLRHYPQLARMVTEHYMRMHGRKRSGVSPWVKSSGNVLQKVREQWRRIWR